MDSSHKRPYYAVIFTSVKKLDVQGYDEMAARMETLSRKQSGFLGQHSVRESSGLGITVSYWQSEEDIAAWKANVEHQIAQDRGKSDWYEGYEVRVCKVEREHSFGSLQCE